MDSNAGYVLVAYLVVCLVLGSYGAWLAVRLRRAERSFGDANREESSAADRSP